MQEIQQVVGQQEQKQTASSSALMVHGRPIRPWIVLISLVFGFFMALLDATIVNIAIPSIQSALKTDLPTVSWTLNAYNLVFAVLLITVGRFADQYGRKRLFMIGMIIFSIGSLLCALAETFGSLTGLPAINWLIAFRALQAIGAAGLNPISLAIIISIFPPKQRGAAIGVWGALSGLAAAVGPILGGFLVENFDWRWIFFVNLPFCLIGLIMVWLNVPETRDIRVSKHIDILGALTLSLAIFCVVLAIIEGNAWGWASLPILSLFGLTVISLIAFGIVEIKQADPMIDFALFKAVSFTGANLTMFLFGIAIQGAFLILVLYFINARGYDQLHAAYALLPVPLAAFVVSALSGRLSHRVNPGIMGIIGMVAITIGFVLLCFINSDTAYIDVAWRSIFLGLGMGMLFQSQPAIALSEVPPAKLGVASGVFNTFRQIGFTLGVAVLISVFTGTLTPNLQTAQTHSVAIVNSHTALPEQLRSGIITGLQNSHTTSNQTSEAGSSGSTTQSVDLTKLADKLPPQVPVATREAIRSDLKVLGDQISAEFLDQVTNSFKSAWWSASIFALSGVLAALIAFLLHRPKAPASEDAKREAQAHASLG
ncbi:MFS transporter [Tengunoibacter tsumagoiensis]|uniref:Major facilitator superfamily (MFS) profile domain-containing protein n=1 Tax=Tengunoibacter tsumagoiensis TaxID=2014871 RepID=A0A402AB30_9CHLR|nr:MFS transporter [Tengunoibacter tsumagoiensis]GCE16165.1 hypothetical protein KTT_60240 [Tengunoibacter tsumagoiensis]